MKRLFLIFVSVLLVFSLVACSNSTTNTPSGSSSDESQTTNNPPQQSDTVQPSDEGSNTESGKILIAYFSKTGNTETVAKMIEQETSGTLFKVETVTAYPEDYNETVDIARKEQDDNARPELSTHVENMDEYDVIFLGYPNWWGTMPQAMFTFLEEYDFSGKTIIPFCTHGGSALGRSEDDIASLCPDTTLLEGLAISGSRADSAGNEVKEWISGLDIAE